MTHAIRPKISRRLRPQEVAELFGVDPKTVTRWATEGKLPYITTPGGHRRYPEAEILAMIEGPARS